MIAPEDFTFPVISTDTNTNTNAAVILPPLWRISDSDQGSTAARQRRTFAGQITKVDGQGSEAEAESQEKMDLLWEDFNEQLQSSVDSSDSETHNNNNNNNCPSDEFEEYANVRRLKLIRAKPKKLGSLVKEMKKLFSVSDTTPYKREILV